MLGQYNYAIRSKVKAKQLYAQVSSNTPSPLLSAYAEALFPSSLPPGTMNRDECLAANELQRRDMLHESAVLDYAAQCLYH